MLTTVAVLPQPPLLVPELATGATAETAPLRSACLDAATRLGAAAARWIAVGADDGGRRSVGPGSRGTFAGFGVDLPIALDTAARRTPDDGWNSASGTPGPRLARSQTPTRAQRDPDSRAARPRLAGTGEVRMPLPLLIAGWVAGAAGLAVTIRGELVAPDAPRLECAALGAELAAECAADPEPVGLLVVGDGAATHTEKAPGHLDERAGPFDRAVAAALRSADPAGLAELDPRLAGELHAVGRAPWQVLAAAAAGGTWTGELLYSDAPFGVAYHVAIWTRCR